MLTRTDYNDDFSFRGGGWFYPGVVGMERYSWGVRKREGHFKGQVGDIDEECVIGVQVGFT